MSTKNRSVETHLPSKSNTVRPSPSSKTTHNVEVSSEEEIGAKAQHTQAESQTLDSQHLLRLQRHIGNQAVNQLLTIGSAPTLRIDGARAESHTTRPVIQRHTTIVDDPRDPLNKVHPGQGKGLLQELPSGNINTAVQFGPLNDGCATSMEALLLPQVDDLGGSEPLAGTWPAWWAAAAPTPNNYWVRGHLLNHNLGGPGEARNLTPITKRANSEHHNLVEKLLKKAALEGDQMVAYKVEAIYGGTGPTKLKGDANDPDHSIWSKLTLGFKCEFSTADGSGDMKNYPPVYIENKR